VRNEGYCLVDRELEWGLRFIAVPVMRIGRIFRGRQYCPCKGKRGSRRNSKSKLEIETRNRLLPALHVTATEITKILQAAPLRTLPKKPHS
jgi:hypothetical protein